MENLVPTPARRQGASIMVLTGNRWQPQSGKYEGYLIRVFPLGTGFQKPELLQHLGEELGNTAAATKLKTREVVLEFLLL